MFDPACHLCDRINSAGARVCVACGVGLTQQCARCGRVRAGLSAVCEACGAIEPCLVVSDAADATEAAHAPAAPAAPVRQRPSNPGFDASLWDGLPVLSLDDAVPAAAAHRSGLASGADQSSGLHLRDLDEPDVWLFPDGAPVGRAPVPDARPSLVRSDSFLTPPGARPAGPAVPPVPLVVAMPLAPPSELPAPGFVDHRDKKAARRAAVRRARLAAQAQGLAPEPMPTDLLVVDSDDATRQRLCLLLDGFGFNVQSSRSTAHAASLLASRVYLAVFADVDLQDTRPDGGVDVCRLSLESGPLPDGRRSALILMSARPSAAERVRAALAGSEHFLVKPLTRGDVARALEACDIPLPVDPRRG